VCAAPLGALEVDQRGKSAKKDFKHHFGNIRHFLGDFPVPAPAAANPIGWGGKAQSPPNSSTGPSLKSSSKAEIISGK
jgi:hypothetical protein